MSAIVDWPACTRALVYHGPGIHGWMSDAELRWLFKTAQQMVNAVEIGCWRGRSTHALLSGCGGVVYAVDHFLGCPAERDSNHADAQTQDIKAQFLENVGMFPNLHLLPLESGAAAPFVGELDMVFIDAAHTYYDVKRDLELWAPKARKLVAGHDYGTDDVSRAVREYFGRKPDEQIDGIWAYRPGTVQ